jgi:hypothetical protein
MRIDDLLAFFEVAIGCYEDDLFVEVVGYCV